MRVLTLAAAAFSPGGPAGAEEPAHSLSEIYTHLHANPELSFQEKDTAALLAGHLDALGFEVTTGLGAVERDTWQRAQRGALALPSLHSPHFRSDPEPTLATGVSAMTAAALHLPGERP